MSRWPWVNRKQLEGQATQLFTENVYLKEEIKGLKITRDNLAALCNQLQIKLKDCEEPPISSADLRATLQRLSILQTELEVLRRIHANM